ncbi:DUF4843 domain-containing protein [Pedobacter gandavensis]|uniref:DUF4843 domain-containing protein n=1 Tax=Pedobacter gandavensis TaxID=2679963 RepID=UPI002930EAE2|nr:DUF4843 domain-containing protein [Pedobacter gandavensis]
MSVKNLSWAALGLVLSFTSCTKEEVKFYDGKDRIQFSRLGSGTASGYLDSVDFSFAAKGAILADTMFFPVDVTGRAASQDREFKVELVANESLAIPGQDFEFGKGVIKAGSFKGVFPLILKNTKDLETIRKTVTFKLVGNDAFEPGIGRQLKSKVAFFNFMVKPLDWDLRMTRFFGVYSKTKHRFILYHLGYPEINYAATLALEDPSRYIFGGTKFAYFQLKLRSLLDDLNSGTLKPAADDPFTYPLKDENGLNIIFP